MSDRVRVIPFKRHFDEKDRNLELKDLLKAEVDGVFNWLLKGMNMFLADPLYYPNVIKEATIAYQATSDKLQQFIDDTYVANDDGRIAGKYLYEEYQHWCINSGYKAESKENVFEELKKKGYMNATATLNHKTVKNVLMGFTKITTNPEDEQEMSR
jgi:putative DNA primase/helicase